MVKFKSAGAAIPAQDIKRARKFYEEKIGLTPTQEEADGGATYQLGETGFVLFASMGKASGDHTQMALEVDDVESAVRDLKANGVKFEDYDYPEFKSRDGIVAMPDGSKGAWLKDTEGNLIAINSRVPAPARRA